MVMRVGVVGLGNMGPPMGWMTGPWSRIVTTLPEWPAIARLEDAHE
jgi:hypothetical protein